MVSAPSEPASAGPHRVLLDAVAGPVHPAARDVLLEALDRGWADPRRRYAEAARARRLLDEARSVLAEGLRVRPDELSFTAGGEQALRWGLTGLRYAGRRRGPQVVASAVERAVVLTTIRDAGYAWYAGSPGAAATPTADDPTDDVSVDHLGRVDLQAWSRALDRPGVAAAALQAANGEVGTRQPLAAAHEQARARGIPLLVDATATLGRDEVPTDYEVLAGDARSWGGPPGLGVLVVPSRTRWRRPGPPAEAESGRTDDDPVIPLAVAAAAAWRATAADRQADAGAARALVDRIRVAAAQVPDTEVVGDPHDRLPHVCTFSCLFVDGEALVEQLDRRGFAVASGSACTASTLRPSHVLAAMGVLTHGNVRVTLPLQAVSPDREEGVQRFCAALPDAVATVRAQLGPR